MSPAKSSGYFAPTERRLAAEDRSDARRELLDVADYRSYLALKMSLAAGAIEDVLTLPEWDGDWTSSARRRVQTERRRADVLYTDALDGALEAITEATAPVTNPETENTNALESPHDPSTAQVTA